MVDANGNPLTGIDFGADGVPVDGYYDADLRAIVVEEIAPQGGQIVVAGQIMNTGKGELRVANGYTNVNISNLSNYNLIINEIDTTTDRVGKITIIDTGRDPIPQAEFIC